MIRLLQVAVMALWFSASVVELSKPELVGTMLTLQTALGFANGRRQTWPGASLATWGLLFCE